MVSGGILFLLAAPDSSMDERTAYYATGVEELNAPCSGPSGIAVT
jgi:hypothetical protein